MDDLSRRSALKAALGLPVLPVLDPPPPDAFRSALCEVPHGGHWRIDIRDADGYWRATPVPRWEVPSIAAAEQPRPVFTDVSPFGSTMILRWWQPGDVAKCGLCRTCSASVTHGGTHPGLAACVREAPGRISAGQAALYREGDEVTISLPEAMSNFFGLLDDDDFLDDDDAEGGPS